MATALLRTNRRAVACHVGLSQARNSSPSGSDAALTKDTVEGGGTAGRQELRDVVALWRVMSPLISGD